MIEEFVNNKRLANFLRGVNISRAFEHEKVPLIDSLRKERLVSEGSENFTEAEEADVMRLIEKTRKELGKNGDTVMDRAQERDVFTHMLEGVKFDRISAKFDSFP